MTTDTVGGVWGYALTLAEGLATCGVEVVLATMGRLPTAVQARSARAIPRVRLETSAFDLEWMDEPWDDVDAAGEWLLRLSRRYRPDLIHLNGYAHAALPFDAPVLVVAHSCVLSWWRAVRGEPAPARYAPYLRRVRDGLRAAGAVVAPTEAMLSWLERDYGPLPRGQVIPNGIDVPSEAPSDRAPFFLAAGRAWDEGKNLAVLAEVSRAVSWPVRVAGEVDHPNGGARPLSGVEALGRVDAPVLRALMKRAAVFVHPARYEPFGLAPLEAAAGGCALLLADLPSLREVWGDAALYAAPEPEPLARGARRLAEDPGLLREMARRARRRAERYGHVAMVRRYLSTYARLLDRGTADTRGAARVAP